jgi:8-oxo-dGTP diphosphatase
MPERHKAVPASYLILIHGGSILLGRRFNTGYYDGYYSLPSGHVEAGELPLEALAREATEEIGISIQTSEVRLVHTMYRAKHDATGERVDLFFLADTWSGTPANCEPHKCDDLRWFSPASLPANMVDHVLHALQQWQAGNNYSEIPLTEGWFNPNEDTK